MFDIVIATNCDREESVRINSICRTENVLFYAGAVFGFYGFSFMDLISHEYVEEVTQPIDQGNKEDEPVAKKQKTETETKSVKKAMTFVSLAETLKVDWSSELYAKRIRRMDPSYFLLQVLFNFQAEFGHAPRSKERENDLNKLKEMRNKTLSDLSVPVSKIPDDMLGNSTLLFQACNNWYFSTSSALLFAELSPVCAIVGGVLAQEVIKAISNKDAPHNNYFFYNPLESCGIVETIGY